MKRAAVSYVEREDGRILCVWNKRYGGWSMPGGLVEDGETPEVAQRRELKEETGLDTFAIWPMHEGPATNLPENANRASYVHVFRVLAKGTPREREIGCAVTWLTRDEFLRWSPFRDIYAPVFEANPVGRPSSQTPTVRTKTCWQCGKIATHEYSYGNGEEERPYCGSRECGPVSMWSLPYGTLIRPIG